MAWDAAAKLEFYTKWPAWRLIILGGLAVETAWSIVVDYPTKWFAFPVAFAFIELARDWNRAIRRR